MYSDLFCKIHLLTLFFILLINQNSFSVNIGNYDYYNPSDYVEMVTKNVNHPAHNNIEAIKRAFSAVFLIPKKATGVIISRDGWAITSAHVISDFYVGETDDCSKIHPILYYEKGSPKKESLICEKIAIYSYNDDFVLFKLKGSDLPYIDLEADAKKVTVGMHGIIAGHPNASNFHSAQKVVSEGEIVLYDPKNEEIPHFLHLIDTEGGHSGAPVLSSLGKMIGIHFRGIPEYKEEVEVTINGQKERIRRFNVAISIPYLYEKYQLEKWVNSKTN